MGMGALVPAGFLTCHGGSGNREIAGQQEVDLGGTYVSYVGQPRGAELGEQHAHTIQTKTGFPPLTKSPSVQPRVVAPRLVP